MQTNRNKPTLVFFQYRYPESLPEFLLRHQQDHVKCLSEFFQVIVIREDCDYQQICDKYQPNITLFESGVNNPTCQRLKIRNIHACPGIPKLGLHNGDAWCEARSGFLSDMEHWGIETFFSISTTEAEHLPELADSLFIWPNFIDPEIYRDYAESKTIPILITGARNAQYPWRQRIYKLVTEYYPSLICPHHGYSVRTRAGQVMYGEQYARTINASLLVPTCGTIAKEVVRKHFEIPACKACLITERSAGIEAAGFVDMKNCVFVDEGDALDKLDYLFKNPDEIQRIANDGYQLVHSHHTLKQRDQIFQWFSLYRILKPNQRIVQSNPFGKLALVERTSEVKNSHLIAQGLHLALLSAGDERLWAGKYQQAEHFYVRCLNHIYWMPEPQFRLALCNLIKGDAKMALHWIVPPIEYVLGLYKASDPDPVEWAYFVICLLCLGELEKASKRACEFPSLRHPELDRVRWVTNVLQGRVARARLPEDDGVKYRFSIHRLPRRGLDEWVKQLCLMLTACHQRDWAEMLLEHLSRESLSFQAGQGSANRRAEILVKREEDIHQKTPAQSALSFRKEQHLNPFNQGWRLNLKKRIGHFAHRLEAKFGCFLPYRLSEMRNDEFFHAIQRLARNEDIKAALVIGAAKGEGSTEAFLTGIRENQNKPYVFCINGSTRRFANLQKSVANDHLVRCYAIAAVSPEHFSEQLEQTVRRIKEENQTKFFDAVLIDSSELSREIANNVEPSEELCEAQLILLDDINTFYNYKNHHRLIRDVNYAVVAENPGLRNGYAIFKRVR